MAVEDLWERDTFTLSRPQGGPDTEGRPKTGYDSLGSKRCTWGSPRATDRERAARADQDVDAVAACKASVDVRVDDKLGSLRGADWVVTAVEPNTRGKRAFLRRV